MAQGQLTRPVGGHDRPESGRYCPDCGSTALVTHRVREHPACGFVYFEDDIDGGDDCPKCGDPLVAEETTRRGTVDRCPICRCTLDATTVPDEE